MHSLTLVLKYKIISVFRNDVTFCSEFIWCIYCIRCESKNKYL